MMKGHLRADRLENSRAIGQVSDQRLDFFTPPKKRANRGGSPGTRFFLSIFYYKGATLK